jgi:Coenzyme PQQ synthesis protein D (PqqD)
VKPKDGVVTQEIEGELVLLDLENNTYYALDEVGARCWALLGEQDALDGVVAAMLEEYDVDEATLRRDLDVLLEELRAAGLVTEAHSSA